MINREITYERDINKSYMKIPAIPEENLDEKIIFRRNLEGFLPTEKCYVNGKGQYWYNISGKQALDTYCNINTIDKTFFETLFLQICSCLEILEWNLIDTSCLSVEPEFIFWDSKKEEFTFLLYPQNGGHLSEEFQQLLEYLLTKIDHKDKQLVHAAYHVYEVSLSDGYSIFDMRDMILENRIEERKKEQSEFQEVVIENPLVTEEEKTKREPLGSLKEKLTNLYDKARVILLSKPEDLIKRKNKEEEFPIVIYPEEHEEENVCENTHPTVCIGSISNGIKGVLVYEGKEAYPDYELEKNSCEIGKSYKARLQIDKDTISQLHARIDYMEDTYYIEDLNSTNGTYVNDELLNYKKKRPLSVGDVIRFADVKYRFL